MFKTLVDLILNTVKNPNIFIVRVEVDFTFPSKICQDCKKEYTIPTGCDACLLNSDTCFLFLIDNSEDELYKFFALHSSYALTLSAENYIKSVYDEDTLKKDNPLGLYIAYLQKKSKKDSLFKSLMRYLDHIKMRNPSYDIRYLIFPYRTRVTTKDILVDKDL